MTAYITTDFGFDDEARSVTVQRDGKILVAGVSDGNFALVRYNANGSLDASFSGDGKLTSETGSGYDVLVQPDGKILLAGESSGRISVVRYNPDGSLDSTFGNSGRAAIDVGAVLDSGQSVALQADGKILVAGYSKDTLTNLGFDFSLVRFNTNGSLDTSFSSDGKVTTAFGTANADYCYDITVQSDGKILLVGGSDHIQALVRYDTDGGLDTTFDDDGRVKTAGFNGVAVSLQADGKILVAGGAGYPSDSSLVRYNTNGSLDPTFGNAGAVKTDFGSSSEGANSVVIQPDGKIVVAGFTLNVSTLSEDYALSRYNQDGSLDTSFSGDGKVTVAIGPPGNTSYYHCVTLQSDGKIIVAGSSGSYGKYDFAVVRFNANGSLDSTFDGKEDVSAPSIVTFRPVDESTGVSTSSDLVVTFSETIQPNTGSITLKDTSGATLATYDVASSPNLTISGNTLTINPSKDLGIFTGYKVEIGAGAIRDLAGNHYAGVSDYNFTTATVDSLYHFFVVAFNAAPGKEYMNQLAQAYNYPLTVKEIVNIFTTKAQFTDIYPVSLSHEELATSLVANIVKNSATAQAKQEAISDIKGALDIGWTVGDMIFTVFGNLANKSLTDPTWGGTAQQFINETAVARYYTEVMGAGGTDLPTLRAVIASVDNHTDVSTPAVIATLIGVELAGVH